MGAGGVRRRVVGRVARGRAAVEGGAIGRAAAGGPGVGGSGADGVGVALPAAGIGRFALRGRGGARPQGIRQVRNAGRGIGGQIIFRAQSRGSASAV